MLGKGHGSMGHALLVLALMNFQIVGFLLKRLTQTHHIAVSGQHEYAAHEPLFHVVIAHILIFQEAHQRLRHSQSNGLHLLSSM